MYDLTDPRHEHDWKQTLPIQENILRCCACGYTKRMESKTLPKRRTWVETAKEQLFETGGALESDKRCGGFEYGGYGWRDFQTFAGKR